MGSTSGQELKKLWSQIRHHPRTNSMRRSMDGAAHIVCKTQMESRGCQGSVVLKDGVLKCFGMGLRFVDTIGVGHQGLSLILGETA